MIVPAPQDAMCYLCGGNLPPGQFIWKIIFWSGGFNVSIKINLKKQ
jgi:hypothetical protein